MSSKCFSETLESARLTACNYHIMYMCYCMGANIVLCVKAGFLCVFKRVCAAMLRSVKSKLIKLFTDTCCHLISPWNRILGALLYFWVLSSVFCSLSTLICVSICPLWTLFIKCTLVHFLCLWCKTAAKYGLNWFSTNLVQFSCAVSWRYDAWQACFMSPSRTTATGSRLRNCVI